ncbi:MAG: rhomboid family intramembrane serine protease [Proteobacteria bacterium]|nr:rhomboid family intramembrane serine protease [Pseudomonadota bacterium]
MPRFHRPTWGASIVVAIILLTSYFLLKPTVLADQQYIDNYHTLSEAGLFEENESEQVYLARRPLLSVTISPKSWDLERAIFSNFVHGGFTHLALNLIGVVAGVRICTTFIPFACTFSIFLIGGTLGLLFSTLVSPQLQNEFVPHLGASAGVFALMGTYYIYNFRFRTTYFFWFPSRQGRIALKTSWFFFLDVILLELLLSAGQLLPKSIDGVDHLAHVGGFLAGCILAVVLRSIQKWPSILQTRGEFLYWTTFLQGRLREAGYDRVQAPYVGWMELLRINFFNDLLKTRLVNHLAKHPTRFTDEELKLAFRYFGPTYVRLNTLDMSSLIRGLVKNQRALPEEWLGRMPYDTIIRVSHQLTQTIEDQEVLLEFILAYRRAHSSNKKLDRKVENLLRRIQTLIPDQKRALNG